jgi:hypothetical protein
METQPNLCKIMLDGPLDERWASYLGDLSFEVMVQDGRIITSTLTGNPADLAEFIGILTSIHTLGLHVMSAEFTAGQVDKVHA